MVTNAEVPPPEPGKLDVKVTQADEFIREVVAGRRDAPIRRILLYLIVALALGMGFSIFSLLGMTALIFLMATD